tara:strand:+ start:85 stop:204 length:120 start_codon:yes stop_codon:yes gene_type:complete
MSCSATHTFEPCLGQAFRQLEKAGAAQRIFAMQVTLLRR